MNSFTIDLEDFGQLMCRDHLKTIEAPLKDITRQTDTILELLNFTNNKATFFVLGMLAKFRADIIKKIAAEGHEIALHGMNHPDMRKLNRQTAYDDILESYNLITDITGSPIFGYRAPYFSVDNSNLYLLEVLTEIGLIYDSSIFPVKLKRYGIDNFATEPKLYKLQNGKEIVELPLTIFQWRNKKIPIAGGGYIRISPHSFIKNIFRRLNSEQADVTLYMHPYEFDTERIDCASTYPQGTSYSKTQTFLVNLKWNLFRKSILPKIKYLLENYEFITCLKKIEYVKNNTNSSTVLEY
jgi:polysaccharide deacetylase family protein (PEP-CTERM system associated)